MQFYGEDASLCGMEFSLRSVKDRAIKLSFEGFDQKLPKFARLCIDKIFDCSKRGFDQAIVDNSIEKSVHGHRTGVNWAKMPYLSLI